MKKVFGFTLAEVLIVLGIVGIVASMTLPTLIQNYQKKVWVNSLKKDFTMIQNACRMMLANDGVDTINETNFYKSISSSNKSDFEKEAKKYYKDLEVYYQSFLLGGYDNGRGHGYSTINNSNSAPSALNTSKAFKIPGADVGVSTEYKGLTFYVDVNGTSRGPNIAGYDLFRFTLEDNCRFKPKGIYDRHVGGGNCIASKLAFQAASTCFDEVVNNGWEIKYAFSYGNSDGHDSGSHSGHDHDGHD